MAIEILRGFPQVVSGICWVTFGIVMIAQALMSGQPRWWLRWHFLSGMAMFFAGYSLLVHAFYWIGIVDAVGLDNWRLVVPLWLQMSFTIIAFIRWIIDPDETNRKEGISDVHSQSDESPETIRDGCVDQN